MGKRIGIIAEYNPFHNGHLYQIQKAKELTGADTVITVMSGNFTQRGDTSLINKFEKAKIALQNEVDMVIELPTIYSISSAENFALGGVKILNEIGNIDYLVFGIEEENLEKLQAIADVLVNEDDEFKRNIKEELDKGNSYPKAREIVLKKVLSSENVKNIMQKPNNILAIEYLKALKTTNSKIKPFAIKRKNTMHNDENINENYASGTYIRKLFIENNFNEIKKVVPKYTYERLLELKNQGTYVSSINDFSDIVIYKIRTMTKEEISQIADVNEGLENSIKLASTTCKTIDEIIDKVSTKRYTKTRISRILTYILLDITKSEMEQSKNANQYIRVLGINKKCEGILKTINNNKLITSLKKFEENNRENQLLNIDKKATEIYTIKYPKSVQANLDYTSKFIIKI
ncbi:MAG: nucleotidyltransferase [Clostridiales bacterium]|nr:nucleotidyltransferase [Clostridiales bacterium]